MADAEILLTITGADGFAEELSDFDGLVQLEIVRDPECCPECRANQDPYLVMSGPNERGGVHPNCRCYVRFVGE